MSKEAEKLADVVFKAAINCGHEIGADQIVLYFNQNQPGRNALNQLHLRIEEACRRQAEQIRELRTALERAADALTVTLAPCGEWPAAIKSTQREALKNIRAALSNTKEET